MLNSLIDLMTFVCFFRGEIKDLFEKVTREELEMSLLSGDKKKQNQMRYLLQALPYHTEEIDTLEKLARNAATTQAPQVQPEIPSELKELLKSYGLLDKNGNPVELSPLPVSPDAEYPFSHGSDDGSLSQLEGIQDVQQAALVSAKDYEAFKPIEANKQNVSSEMESFLKQFGLLDNADVKKRKTNKTRVSTNNPSIDAAHLNPEFSRLLGNIGVTVNNKNGVKSVPKTASKPDYKKAGDDDYKKLEQLLETIKELEELNTTLTEKEVERLNLQNYNFSDSLMSAIGPDPLTYDLQYGALRNEVKRQNPTEEPTRVSLGLTSDGLLESSLEDTDNKDEGKESDTSSTKTETSSTSNPSSTTTTEAPSTTTATSASSTEEAKKNSLEDEIEPVEDPEPLPPPRRSGFYMLFDWNTFLEVGEDPDKIVVRFDPKIGDPSRFLPVSVP